MASRSYILPPAWYPWTGEQSPITLGTVYSDHLMTRDARRWKGKGDLKTLVFNDEEPGEARIQKEAHWDLSTWIKFLDFLNIGFGGGKAEDVVVNFKWDKLERMEVDPDFEFPTYCHNLVSNDRREYNGETMSAYMHLGRTRRHKPLWIVSGIQIATGLEIWVEGRNSSHSHATAGMSDPHSSASGGFSGSQGSGFESFKHHKVNGKVIFACQMHKIDHPKLSDRSRIRTRLEQSGAMLSEEAEAELQVESNLVEVTGVDLNTDPRMFHMY